jgi:phenylpyruvate tautomerase PptA (4-oxalocrotonate tautomerase family)
MPQIDVHLIKGVFDTEQKRQIIQRLTDAIQFATLCPRSIRIVSFLRLAV